MGGRRPPHCLHLDAVRLGRPRGRGRALRAPARQRAGRLRVHGRRVRVEERPRRAHLRGGRAGAEDGPAGQVHADPAGGESRRRKPQRDDPATSRRRPFRRHADRPRRRVRELERVRRLARLDGRADADALQLRERQHGRVRGQAQHAADEGVPRAGLRRGHVRPRVPDGRAGREARSRSARATPPQLRRPGCHGRTAVLVEAASSSATGGRSRTGPGARKCARARTAPGSAASASRARSGTGAAARRRTPGSGSAQTQGSPSSPRCRTSAPAARPRWRRSPRRSSGCRSTAWRSRSETPREARTPRSQQAPRRSRRWGRPSAQPPPTPPARSSRSRRSATTARSARCR